MSNVKDSLDIRLAKGEISLEEYQKTLATLEKHAESSEIKTTPQTTVLENIPLYEEVPTSGMAIASLILGIASFFCSLLTAIPGLILGILGLKKIKTGEKQGKGLAIAGIILNCVSIVILIVMIFGYFYLLMFS